MSEAYDSHGLLPVQKKKPVLPAIAAVAVLAAGGSGYYGYKAHGAKTDAEAQLAKLQDENKSLNDALTLLRSTSDDVGNQLNGCKQELTTQASTLQDVDGKRGALEAELGVCRSNVQNLEQETKEQQALLAEFKGLTGKFQRMIDSGKLEVVFRRGKMVVKLPDAILFPSGSAALSDSGKQDIAEVAAILKQMRGRRFTVAGHTDNVPVGGGSDNWELSALRAVKVTQLLIDKGVPDGSLVAAGYGQFDPIASNATAAGRKKNRRIEIILEPNLKPVDAAADKLMDKAAPKKATAKAAPKKK